MFKYFFSLPNLKATENLAKLIANVARVGDVLTLQGDLGAGKTTFARAFIQSLAQSDMEVPSPTFTLVQTYDLPHGEVWHFDLYRLESAEEIFELGLEEGFSQAITLVEWPERLAGYVWPPCLKLVFSQDPQTGERSVCLEGEACWQTRLPEANTQV